MFKKLKDNKSGESIIIVVVIAIILTALAGVALAFASGNVGTANKEVLNKKSYYVTKSVVSVVDESIQNGEIGRYLRTEVLNNLVNSGSSTVNKNDWNFSPEVSFGDAIPSGFKVEEMTITFDSKAQSTSGTGTGSTGATVSIDNLKVEIKAGFGTGSYSINAEYSYTGWANRNSGSWEWTNEKWTRENISQ